MSTESTEPSLSGGKPSEEFRTTSWTLVRQAKADSPEGRGALAELCQAYYEPVVTFLRCETGDAERAREIAHEFFAEILGGSALSHAKQERGRFRSYLLGAVKHFLGHRREAAGRLKRGGAAEHVSLCDTESGEERSIPDTQVPSPDAAFDREWALTVLARSLQALRQECVADGRAEFFEHVKPWLTGEGAHGEQQALAASCGMNANALKVAIHRLKQRFRELLKMEVAGTLEDPSLVEIEMRALFAALEH